MKGRIRRLRWRIDPPVIALGGGGARGFAHIGVLQVLEEQRLPVRGIVGTSMGALIGAMFLVHDGASRVYELWSEAVEKNLIPSIRPMRSAPEEGVRENPLVQVARKIRNRVVVSFAMNRRTMLDDVAFNEALRFLVPDVDVASLLPRFVAAATDLETGEEVRLGSGSLHSVLRATSAIPGFLPAVELDGRWLVDGGVVAEVPVGAARSLARNVVAVDVSMNVQPLAEDRLVLDTMMRTQMMTARLLRGFQLRPAAAIIRPEVGHATWSDWHHFNDLVEAGRIAARTWLGLT